MTPSTTFSPSPPPRSHYQVGGNNAATPSTEITATATAAAMEPCSISSVAAAYVNCVTAFSYVDQLNSTTLIGCIDTACNADEDAEFITRALYQCEMLECQARLNNGGSFPTTGTGYPW
ncbi:hypothetical protein BDK51DRAFT_52431 [Blyttiomyces helicus]|uniref:Uncharacterized protein n=1 Tax=Blyttiomyces helicus TaxID=388810 RepID=A0A4P9W5B9_9FUNG|nr:hypothetical protein BDK51DRAFT_52431 [Blyttiomyces helicus]|eukprot:RKO86513.1 hypothetical protein BDK51DRAFT_52431 [Blyttiomyces helicus]